MVWLVLFLLFPLIAFAEIGLASHMATCERGLEGLALQIDEGPWKEKSPHERFHTADPAA
jgi:hypothetical protein